VSEEASQVSQLALLEPMNALILTLKKLREFLLVDLVNLAESLACVSIELQICSLLHAALDNHVAEFDFLARSDLKFEELVTALFVFDGRHDNQVDRLAELHKILVCEVFDFLKKVIKVR
jgi:hypothetical protein